MFRTIAALAGLLGGLAWIVASVLGDGSATDSLSWAGAVLLGVATLGAGAGLVTKSTTWLRVIVGVCFVLLVASVVMVLQDGMGERTVHGVLGAAAVVVAVVALARRPEAAAVGGHRASRSHAR